MSKLTIYQTAVIETWIAEQYRIGVARAEALAAAQCQLPDELSADVAEIYNRRWPDRCDCGTLGPDHYEECGK